MLSLRLLFAAAMFLSIVLCNSATEKSDRIELILMQMIDMNKKMDSLTSSVKQISETEELTEEHVGRIEDRVEGIEGKVPKLKFEYFVDRNICL